jgi:hypothetical protein
MTYDIKITPRSERETVIEKRISNSDEFGETIYEFRSGSHNPRVISVPIDLPVYRMENCRTFSAQQSDIATQDLEKDFFAKGQELSTAQQIQHNILAKLAKQGTGSVTPIFSELEKDGQRASIIISSTGVVVDGNRRLAAMRELVRSSNGAVDERFTHVKCAVLPTDTTRDEIDDIEADLQARRQTKLEYDWIGDARLVRRQVNKNRTTKEVADRLRRSKPDIENVLQALDEADLYLSEWVEKPGQYDLVAAEGQQIFGDIPKNTANKESGLVNASRAIAWSLFENRNRITGRVYNLNAAFGKLAPQVLDIMSDQLELDDILDQESDDDDFAFDIDGDSTEKNYLPIIDALRNEETKDDAVTVLIEACETAIELDKGQKNEKAALKALSQVNAKLTGIDVDSAGLSTLPAMLKQVQSIRNVLDKIEKNVQKRQSEKLTKTSTKE